MSLKTAYIALGGNLGDRIQRMREALDQLEAEGDIRIEEVSPVYNNPAVGLGNVPDFLNAVACVQTSLSPQELLRRCLSVEAVLGRVRSGQPTSRTIDLDLLLYEDVQLDTPSLQLPHPRIEQRDFVARPLMDIAPGLLISGKLIESILSAIPAGRMSPWAETLR
jgi:2-amino-4-hydroxy-6-hydroxymethyldihydropteridine diphosphokinase